MEERITQEDLKAVLQSLDGILDSNNEVLVERSIAALLAMPEKEFNILKPGITDSFKNQLNSPNNRVMMVQNLNMNGEKVEDMILYYEEILKDLNRTSLNESKKDFLKEILSQIITILQSTEGVSKRFVKVAFEMCHPDAKVPQYAHISDSGMDLYALEDYTIKPGETMLIPTGIKFALPPGYELQVRPKSGRALKTKLRVANTPGTVDAGYRDELKVIIENVEPPIKDITYEQNENGKLEITSILYGSSYTIGKGEKFAQIVLSEVPKISLFQVDKVSELGEDRGGGFGSTGLQ